MAKRRDPNWCMFGVNKEKADKGVLVGYNKKFGAYTLSIFQLKEPVGYGERWRSDNAMSEIFNLCFCNKKSLDGFIKQLMVLKSQWEIKDGLESNVK